MPAEVFHNYSMFNYKGFPKIKSIISNKGLSILPNPHPNETFPGLWLVKVSSRVRTELSRNHAPPFTATAWAVRAAMVWAMNSDAHSWSEMLPSPC